MADARKKPSDSPSPSTSRLSAGERPGATATNAPKIRSNAGLPWLTILSVGLVAVLVGAIAWFVVSKTSAASERDAAAAPFVPTAENRDPSVTIPGILIGASTDRTTTDMNRNQITIFDYPAYRAAMHVTSDQRVKYDRHPAIGGPHDGLWADCTGVVYDVPVREENMVHTLEHGAIWIAYNPDMVTPDELNTLKGLVNGQSYISMSPYPGLGKKVSLQAWAHQLQLDSVTDERIVQFITALRQNIYVYPETGATCQAPQGWDVKNPLPFDATPPGADAIGMDGEGAVKITSDEQHSSMASSQGASVASSAAAASSASAASAHSGHSSSAAPASGATTSASK